MYRYDAIDQDMVQDRAREFRIQVARRLAGEITEDQFKPLRLMNGLYLQLHAYMLRVAIPYGSLNPTQMRKLAWIGRTYDKGYGHFTTRQNLQFHWIKLADTPDINLVSDIIACPGLDYCALANARAIPIAQQIATRFEDAERAEAVGELKIRMSGCINACGHHHVGHIGILGVDKKGEEFYQLTLGGSGAEDASLGSMLGPALPYDKVADAVDTLVDVYLRERQDGERFLDTYRRTGVTPFKEAVYADAD